MPVPNSGQGRHGPASSSLTCASSSAFFPSSGDKLLLARKPLHHRDGNKAVMGVAPTRRTSRVICQTYAARKVGRRQGLHMRGIPQCDRILRRWRVDRLSLFLFQGPHPLAAADFFSIKQKKIISIGGISTRWRKHSCTGHATPVPWRKYLSLA